MSKRQYTLTREDADDARAQVGSLAWPDGSPVVLGDFGNRLRLSGVLFQGEGVSIVIRTPTALAYGSELKTLVEVPPGTVPSPELELPEDERRYHAQPNYGSLAAIIRQTDDPVYFERDETGIVKAVVRKVQAQISGGTQWAIWERDGFKCMYCGKAGGSGTPLTLDHFVPLEQSGSSSSENLLSCCRRCGKLKGSRDPGEFCDSMGYDYDGLRLWLAGEAPMSFISHLV